VAVEQADIWQVIYRLHPEQHTLSQLVPAVRWRQVELIKAIRVQGRLLVML
jgi:hypothetical protein